MAILGIDEVGRGPLAGPLVIGAVILPEKRPEWVAELKDSKKLTSKKRQNLNEIILREALAVGLGWVMANEIDEIGVSDALKLATRRAVEEVQKCHVAFSQIVIDGKVNFLKGTELEKYVSVLVKADDLIKEVSAASIVAKVARDNYMIKIAEKFPEYGFEKHVGYGTAVHIAAINKNGVCEEHRLSFEPCKSLVGFHVKNKVAQKNTTKIGSMAEAKVAEYLMSIGHKVVARNFKTKMYEIDIVSILGNKIYFTEVKYRKDNFAGGGLAAVDNRKLTQMKFAAESFLKYKINYKFLDPILAVANVMGDDFTVREWFEVE